MFESYIRDQDLEAGGGQIIDAILVPALKHSNMHRREQGHQGRSFA